MASERYFVRSGDRDKGPYTVEQLREAVQQTAMSDQAEVHVEGEEKTEPLRALLRRTEADHLRAQRRGRRIAGVDVDLEDVPPMVTPGQEGDQGLGIALGFLGGIIALGLSFLAKPKTRQGIIMGFGVQLALGAIIRMLIMMSER